MLTINRILCPTDFSEPSYVGLKTANDLALHFLAELILVHVVRPFDSYPSSPADGVDYSLDLYVEETVRASEESLSEIGKNRISPDLRVRSIVLKGNPADRIVDLADSEKVDMIVTATHGSTGWHRFIFGSVAERVVRHANCPVLIVPAPQEEAKEK